MKKKLFVCSDIHGFFDEMKAALDKAGFDPNNENHWFIGVGDFIDRGGQPLEVVQYLMSLPRKVLIRGNHEDLFEDLVKHKYARSHDWHNGTMQTILDLAPNTMTAEAAFVEAYEKVQHFFASMVNYFETENYVFTHGYIPYNRHKNWRVATEREWENARWENGMELVNFGYDIEKCVVVGHIHASWGRAEFEGKPEFGDGADFSPFYYKDKLIAIDGCTAHTGEVNVLVLEDEFIKEGAE